MDVIVFVAALVVLLTLVGVAVCFTVQSLDRRALKRSEALLHQHLTATQLSALDRTGSVQVSSPTHPGRVYSVPLKGFVSVLEDGMVVSRLCVRPRQDLAGREAVLVHKLHIEAAEDDYLRKAVLVWPRGRPLVS